MSIKIQKPRNFWSKPLNLQPKLFASIATLIRDIVTVNIERVPEDVFNIAGEAKLKTNINEKSWLLINRSILRSVISIIKDNQEDISEVNIETEIFDNQINEVMSNDDLYIDYKFFENPKKYKLLKSIQPIIKEFLKSCGFTNDITAKNLSERFPSYFVFSIVEEWKANKEYYKQVEEEIYKSSPADKAAKIEKEWLAYYSWLKKQVNEPLFSESFSLKQVYIILRAYYNISSENLSLENIKTIKIKKEVVNIEDEFQNWLKMSDKRDCIKVIRGGPGYGKSSFLKMLAYSLVKNDYKYKVLFIPLHHFKIKDDLYDSVKNYILESGYIQHNPFENNDTKFLLLFDGLDEITMQGKNSIEAAGHFIEEILRKISIKNEHNIKLKVIISGRDLVIQQNDHRIRNKRCILNLIPYYLKLSVEGKKEYVDNNNLLDIDQRNIWWEKYGKVNGKNYTKLPNLLDSDNLYEITSQPLLNYLVALSFERGKINFSKKTLLNEVYKDLLEAVYERDYDSRRIHKSIKNFNFKDFTRILEEIAITSWHGNGRTSTVKDIENRIRKNNLDKLFKEFKLEAEKGIMSLLTSFYFRKSYDIYDNNETFEFTHKSFGEYLTARRIVSNLKLIHNQFEKRQESYDEGFDEKDCLIKWVKIFGVKEIDKELVKFISNELHLSFQYNINIAIRMQETIIKLINYFLRNGMPMDEINIYDSFKVKNIQSINSEKSIIIILSIISNYTNKISNIKWVSNTNFGEWLSRLYGQRYGTNSFILKHLNNLNLENSILTMKDLVGANLKDSNLQGADLSGTNLTDSILIGTNLKNAILTDSELRNFIVEKNIMNSINTPIMSIAGSTEGLIDLINEYDESIDDEKVLSKDHHEIASDMLGWVKILKENINYISSLITINKSMKNNNSKEKVFSIKDLTSKINNLLRYKLNSSNCIINIENKIENKILIKGEILQMLQVISYIILNSIQAYGEKGGIIELKFEDKNGIIISISDKAGGIPKEIQKNIFINMITTKDINESDFGLYLAFFVIKTVFEGNIWYDTICGFGTTFYIYIKR
ncbi:MAG: pentapeptide repeat-containing protein [Clostridiales bacterium]